MTDYEYAAHAKVYTQMYRDGDITRDRYLELMIEITNKYEGEDK